MGSSGVTIYFAFLAGVLTFFSPCFLPLLPAYLSFVSGVSLTELRSPGRPKCAVVLNTLFFIIGFSLVFILLGASITYLGGLLHDYQVWIRTCGGVIVIGFGLYLLGAVRIGFLAGEKRFQFRSKPAGYLGTIAVGAAFAAGWTPCVGPILGSILVYAGASDTLGEGIFLLIAYSLGLGLPLLVSALLIDAVIRRFERITRYLNIIRIVCGIVLIIMGVMLITDPFHLMRKF